MAQGQEPRVAGSSPGVGIDRGMTGGCGFVSFPKPACIVRRNVVSGWCCHGNRWCVQKVTCSTGGFRTSVLTRKIGHNADCEGTDRKSTRLNSSHVSISYAVFCLKKKKK